MSFLKSIFRMRRIPKDQHRSRVLKPAMDLEQLDKRDVPSGAFPWGAHLGPILNNPPSYWWANR